MKVAVIGSRGITNFDLSKYLPEGTTELVSGGASGVDTVAQRYADKTGMPIKVFLPKYNLYPGKIAPLKRNLEIIAYADIVLAFWDGRSRGTAHVIENCRKNSKRVEVFIPDK